jgi:hypothetical protein
VTRRFGAPSAWVLARPNPASFLPQT